MDMVEKVTPILERITQFRVFLLLASVILAVDVVLTGILGRGVATLDLAGDGMRAGTDGGRITIGGVLLFTAAYAFFMSGVGRALRHTVEWILLRPKLKAWAFFSQERGRDWRQISGRHIRLSKLREKAIETRDAVYLKIADDHEQEFRRSAKRDASLSTLSFSASVLAAADWSMGAPSALGTLHDGLAASGIHLVSVNADAALVAVVVAMAAPWALLYWFRERLGDNADWVYCPAAAREFAEDQPPA